jgi:hypothetical protein
MTRSRWKLAVLAASAFGGVLARRRAGRSPKHAPPGPPAARDVASPERTVINRPVGADTHDPAGQWADDGGGGIGGGQSQR